MKFKVGDKVIVTNHDDETFISKQFYEKNLKNKVFVIANIINDYYSISVYGSTFYISEDILAYPKQRKHHFPEWL